MSERNSISSSSVIQFSERKNSNQQGQTKLPIPPEESIDFAKGLEFTHSQGESSIPNQQVPNPSQFANPNPNPQTSINPPSSIPENQKDSNISINVPFSEKKDKNDNIVQNFDVISQQIHHIHPEKNKVTPLVNSGKEAYLYRIWPGRNKFIFNGRFVCGPLSDISQYLAG